MHVEWTQIEWMQAKWVLSAACFDLLRGTVYEVFVSYAGTYSHSNSQDSRSMSTPTVNVRARLTERSFLGPGAGCRWLVGQAGVSRRGVDRAKAGGDGDKPPKKRFCRNSPADTRPPSASTDNRCAFSSPPIHGTSLIQHADLVSPGITVHHAHPLRRVQGPSCIPCSFLPQYRRQN